MLEISSNFNKANNDIISRMIVVIIAGGSGTRLWPLSTSSYPKQLLKLTNEQSMVQNTYERAKTLSKKIYVVPDISHAHHIKEQLPDLDDNSFIIEPGRRGTANCIIAALAHISKQHDLNEPIAFISADHHIRDNDGFKHSFIKASEFSTASNKIVLVGIEPSYPATGFGYIERGERYDENQDAYKVASFKEKPDFDNAKKYLASGKYLWNCGYFVGSVSTFLAEMDKYAPDLKSNYDKLNSAKDPHSNEYSNTYQLFESNSIDYALIEKSSDLLVIPASFDWADIGSFKDLHSVVELDDNGNHIYGENIFTEELENVYVRNEEVKPIAVIGLDNVVIINTKDGILVSRKDLSQKVGDIAKKIQG